MASSEEKWRISLFSALIFITVVHPETYKLVNKLLGGLIGSVASDTGCPTTLGLIVHTIVFILIVRYSMDLDIV